MMRLLILAFLLCCSAAHGCELPLENSGRTWCLTSETEGRYRISGTDMHVVLAPRLVVRAQQLNKAQLQAVDDRIQSVSELYLLKDATYFLVNVATIDELPALIRTLKALKPVTLIQPDILQLTERTDAALSGAANKTAQVPYFRQLDIPALWATTLGEGVRVAIIDDGFDLAHPELANASVAFAYDVSSGTQDVSPRAPADTHGTRVAGTIFAAHNDQGIDGIAPHAGLIAVRQPDTWTSRTLLSFYLSKLSGSDIVNASWNSRWLLEPVADIVSDLAQNGRSGKGVAVVFSAGNKGTGQIQGSNEASLQDAIVIGSDDGKGQRTGFSNYGPTVDAYVYGKPVPAVVPGGYGRFSGTSLSAAVVSGYFALLLSREPSLTLSQLQQRLQHQLERSAVNHD